MSPMLAARAYAAAQGQALPSASVGETAQPGFADLLRDVVSNAAGATRAAETQMAAHVKGQAELVDVVTAVASAEASLETVMAVRDQVIQAYQEIMRMPI
jgi:flagellar hook-basal body complex protein FliE